MLRLHVKTTSSRAKRLVVT